MNKPFVKVGFIGLLVVMMSSVLLMVFPSKAPWMMKGFSTPILAFEFVQTQNETLKLFGLSDSPDQSAMITAMDSGNRLDYIFMVLYTSFLFFFSYVCVKDSGQKRYYTASILAVIVLFADALENVQLLRITAKITTHDFAKELFFLYRFTWIKWGGIAFIFLILASYFSSGRIYSKIIAITGVLSFVLSVLSYFNRSILNEFMSLSVALMFVMMIVYCFVYKIKKSPQN